MGIMIRLVSELDRSSGKYESRYSHIESTRGRATPGRISISLARFCEERRRSLWGCEEIIVREGEDETSGRWKCNFGGRGEAIPS
jgi:hypothetical protein